MAKLELEMPKIRLNDGSEIPILAFGTGTALYKSEDNGKVDREVVENIKLAIKVGYRHLDCAESYNRERELGAAIKESKIPRHELFVTTKVEKGISDIPKAFENSLQKLGLDYVDLYLIHSPWFAKTDEDLQKAWAELEKIKASGKAKSIGVSNFNQARIEAILKTATVPPSINQTEYNPYLQRGQLREWQASRNIALSAYAPLTPVKPVGQPGPLDGMLDALARKYAVNPGEICLRWVVEQGGVAITTSSKEQRLSDMLRVAAFSMTPREVDEITEVAKSKQVRCFQRSHYAADDYS